MNTVANIFLPTPVTADDVIQFKTDAATEYGNSKTSAMKSAANAYLVWYHCESEYAQPALRGWLDGEIDKLNAEITAHNKVIDDQEAADSKKKKQVKIEGREGASSFTRIVKFVFGFKKPSDASHVSRYSKALEYIEQNKDDLNGELTVDAIVSLLTAAGGFEAAVEKMRGTASNSASNVRNATLQKIKQVVSGISTENEIAFAPKHDQGGYVFLVGRTTATGVMVCGELAINDNEEADALLLKIDGSVMGNPAPAVDFVSRVVSIGKLVHEGREGNAVDTAGSGKKFKIARTYSLLKNGASTQVVVSARYAEASLVVHAYPKGDFSIGSLEQGQGVMLDQAAASKLGKDFSDPALRQLMTLNAVQGEDEVPVRWDISTEMGDATEQSSFEWKSMFGQKHLPLNTRGYDPECRITLTNAQLRELYENELVKWAQTKADDKDAKKPMHVEFDGETLTVGNGAFGYYKLQLAGSKRAHVSLTMRPRDVLDLFKALIAHDVQQCTMSGDNNGMLELSWEDGVGIYSVYVPAVERGSLAKSCLGHIKTTI